MLAMSPSKRVTVIDDDVLEREQLMDDLRDLSYEPLTLTGTYGTDLDRLIGDVQAQDAGFVICDHKLQPKHFANFYGVDVVRRLVAAKRPAMLLTMYQSTDRLDLRAARRSVPVIVGRDAFDAECVEAYATIVRSEISGSPIDARRAHRTLIEVDWIEPGTGHLDAVIPAWSPDHAVTIPVGCVDETLRGTIEVGDILEGEVNIGAKSEDELFFSSIFKKVIPKAIPGVP